MKEDKWNYIEGKCEDLERLKKNSEAAFAIVKEFTKKRIPRLDVINDESGKTLTENEDIKERWVQYSTKLFAAQEQVDTQWEESDEMEPHPLRSEVELAMKQLKDGKSPGFDNLASEMWKATGEEGRGGSSRRQEDIFFFWSQKKSQRVSQPLEKRGGGVSSVGVG